MHGQWWWHEDSRCARAATALDNEPLKFGQPELAGCEVQAPKPLDDAATLSKLYGSAFDANARGHGSILVLGNHGTSTSMLTRLLMLMGLFQGNNRGAHLL